MLILRQEFKDFVKTWNAHLIRKQKRRKHIMPGVPHNLYINPSEEDGFFECAASLNFKRWAELMQYVEQDGFDINDYLSA